MHSQCHFLATTPWETNRKLCFSQSFSFRGDYKPNRKQRSHENWFMSVLWFLPELFTISRSDPLILGKYGCPYWQPDNYVIDTFIDTQEPVTGKCFDLIFLGNIFTGYLILQEAETSIGFFVQLHVTWTLLNRVKLHFRNENNVFWRQNVWIWEFLNFASFSTYAITCQFLD